MNQSEDFINKINNFIKTEKDLSKSNIKKLELINKPYSVRLIKKELQFIQFDFSDIEFKDINECRNAVRLFKASRKDFFKKYMSEEFDGKKFFIKIKKYSDSLDIIDGKVDGYYFPSLSGKEVTKDDGTIKKIFLKRIIFLRFLLYASALSILDKKETVNDIVNNVFKYVLKKGELEKYFDDLEFKLLEIQLSKYKNIISKSRSIINKTKDTDFLIFDIDRVGNEKVNSLFIEIKNNKGELISVKKNKMFNYPIDNKYYKSLKIQGGQLLKISDIDFSKSKIICNFSRREMEHNQENIMWLKFTLDKIINT